MAIFKIKLGEKVKDNITGFDGVVTGRADYITGCRQYLVTPKAIKSEFKSSVWLDEDRLLKKMPKKPLNNGGPQANPAPIK